VVGKPERKRPPGKPNHRWEDNIRMALKEIGSAGVDWIDFAEGSDQWRVVASMVVNILVLEKAGDFLSS
jgi:hypothetical protein